MQPGVPASSTAPHGRARERHSTPRGLAVAAARTHLSAKPRCQAPAFAPAFAGALSAILLCPPSLNAPSADIPTHRRTDAPTRRPLTTDH
jgi:hypothetical protein